MKQHHSDQHMVQQGPDSAMIGEWLIAALAERLECSTAQIDIHTPFSNLGLTSVEAIGLSGDLEDWLGDELSPTLVYDYPDIATLARYLAGEESVDIDNLCAPQPSMKDESIAVIGIGCRFPPDASTPEAFWHFLRGGGDAVSEIPRERWEIEHYYDSDPLTPGKMYTRHGAFLHKVSQFDPQFFGISPREAMRMDPQQRLLLEVSWEALEHAGLVPEKLAGSQTGVFLGLMNNFEYSRLQTKGSDETCIDDPYFSVGSASSIAAGRLAYFFDFRGPTLTIDTACSSALVSLHMACRSLQHQECHLALVGGVNTVLSPESMVNACKMNMLSADGQCKTFDAGADGFVLGEGCGVVVLKRLSDALADRDPILCVVRGSAVNQDGRSNGITAPNRLAQEVVMRQALLNANMEATQIDYVEAHGSGTALGDPIEIAALCNVLGEGHSQDRPLMVGTVKTNIGHLAGAAGIAGFIKTVLALHYREIPPHLHLQIPNPHIPWESIPILVPDRLVSWESEGKLRVAGVSSFGWSGTNAHAILEEAPPPMESAPSRPSQLIMLSARTEKALDRATERLADFLRGMKDQQDSSERPMLADLAYTLQVGRQAFPHRRMLVGRDVTDSLQVLEGHYPQRLVTGTANPVERPVSFLFPGLGEQFVELICDLYKQEKTFQKIVDECCELLFPLLGLDLRIYLNAPGTISSQAGQSEGRLNLANLLGQSRNSSGTLQETRLAQPMTFVVEYALAQLLMQWGIRPQAMLGYSLGEYVVACLAGVFSLQDALTLVAKRAEMIQAMPFGAMLAVALSESEIQPYLSKDVQLAALNAPNTCVLSGSVESINVLEETFKQHDLACRRVQTQHAFHSSMLEPLCAELTSFVSRFELHRPHIPYLSNVTGTWITDEQATNPAYWAEHMCRPVRFSEGIQHLLEGEEYLLLEVGPGQALSSFVRQHPSCDRERMSLVFSTLPASYEQQSALSALLHTLGRLWLSGLPVDWNGFYQQEQRRRIALPSYPFEHGHYWFDKLHVSTHLQRHKKQDRGKWFYQPCWERASLPVQSAELPAKLPSSCLLFLDDTALSERVTSHLEASGVNVVRIRAGSQFAQLDAHHFILRPGQLTDYLNLLQALQKSRQLPDVVLHLWSVTDPGISFSGQDSFQVLQERGFYSLLFLAKALGDYLYGDPVQMLVISNQMQLVNGQDAYQPEKATLLGACTVISQEYQNITCQSIDISLPDCESVNEKFITTLLAELQQPFTGTHVAYRDGERWIGSYEPVHLAPVSSDCPPFRPRGVYLITGGLGGIGLVLARHLARTVQARLVLVGRTPLPSHDSWAAWLEGHEPGDKISIKIRQLQELEALGAELLVRGADVGNLEEMQDVLAEARSQFGALHGVFHLAGTTAEAAFRPIQNVEEPGDCEPHFHPKVQGLYVLEHLLCGYELDFCLFFSSISSVLGGLGFAAYAAANIFIDAFVQYHNQRAITPWMSVNWDTWSLETEQMQTLLKAGTVAEYAMTPEEGLEAVERVLSQKTLTQLVNSTGDLQTRLGQWVRREKRAVQTESSPSTLRAAQTSPGSGDYERQIVEIWQQELGLENVGLYDNFFDLGGNSLIGLQVIARLKKTFRVQIPAVALFEAPTISALVKYLQPPVTAQPDIQAQQLVRRRTEARQRVKQEGIAIIGMSGRFPGAADVAKFWHNLCNGVESIRFFSDEELLEVGVDPALINNPNYVKARPILDDVEHFDASFFGYSPREAELLDPQHRLFLECSWESLEQAGYDPSTYEGLIGVFGGANISTYMHTLFAHPELLRSVDDYQVVISGDKDSLTTGVSYRLNLRGPSFAVQTFCSTSLVAAHLACQSLLNGESDLALAGGVSVRVPTIAGHLYQEGGMESPDGHCRTFDSQARGSIFGDGVGVVVLKRFQEAVEDGDTIYAVIKGSAINNDGSTKVSYTAPSVTGQADVVLSALSYAGVEASSISYVEAHGTATELGDPIEVASLTRAFRAHTDQTGFCGIGSVKTNVGHLDRAAGVSGLIKVALSLYHQQIPPSLHFQEPNPEIDIEHSPFAVVTQLTSWPHGTKIRRAGINSLGMGGTNAHMVLEEAPEGVASGSSRSHQLLVLSARTPTALEAMTENLRRYLEENADVSLADVAFTLQVGRKAFEQRRLLICRDREEALRLLGEGRVMNATEIRADRPTIFLFPGVGEQYVGLTKELYEQEPIFRAEVDRCCTVLEPLMGQDLRSLLYPAESGRNGHVKGEGKPAMQDLRALLGRNGHASSNGVTSSLSPLHRTDLAQPVVFVIEYALARLLMHWGLHPAAMIGYSVGEYVAACLAGVLSLEEALSLVAFRAQRIQELPGGSMLAVQLSEEGIQPYLGAEIQLAAVNAPDTCVLAGPSEAIVLLERRLSAAGIACRPVATTHAFHSRMLAPAQTALTRMAAGLHLHPPQIPFLSNVTGDWMSVEQARNPDYWAQHMCQTVRFSDGVARLLEQQEAVLIEIGPGQALSSFIRQHPACSPERFTRIVTTLPPAYDLRDEQEYLLSALGKLWLAGASLTWSGFWQGERRHRLPLPTYPFERQRYWLAPKKAHRARIKADVTTGSFVESVQALERKADVADWFYQPTWKQLATLDLPDLATISSEKDCWLFFIDDYGVGLQLAERLRSSVQKIITVTPGLDFARCGEQSYMLRPGKRADYEALLQTLSEQGQAPTRIVHLWTITSATNNPGQEEMLERGFYSLIALAQALGDQGQETHQYQLTVISNQLYDVLGSEPVSPEKATILGPCKVIPQEYTNICCRSLDVMLPEAGSGQEQQLLDQLSTELLTGGTEKLVALRGTRRWGPGFEPLHLAASHQAPRRLRRGGTYLITGGLGGIGLALAEYLARTLQARLVLIGRNGLPARSTWSRLLDNATDDHPQARRIRQVLSLEELGSEVLVLSADVTNEMQMRAVIAETQAAFGVLHGVFHTAGLPGVGLIQLKAAEAAAQVLSPKVQGTLVLEHVLKDLALDFLVLFSSITSITGGPGQVDYCAANAFLDAYAHNQTQKQRLTLSIDWSEWQWNAWEEGLSGYSPDIQAFFKESRERFGIHFAEGMEALERLLDRDLSQVIVSTQDFQELAGLSATFTAATLRQQEQLEHQNRCSHPRPALGTSYLPPRNTQEQQLVTIWEALLGIEQIGINDNFFELGGNSLMGIDLIARVRKAFDMETLATYVLYEAPSIATMAQYIEQGRSTSEVETRYERGEKRRKNLRRRMHVEAKRS